MAGMIKNSCQPFYFLAPVTNRESSIMSMSRFSIESAFIEDPIGGVFLKGKELLEDQNTGKNRKLCRNYISGAVLTDRNH